MAQKMTNYLVFEGSGGQQMYTGGSPSGFAPVSWAPVAAVSARDETEAVKFTMARTRRISKYAVVEAHFVDFTADLGDEPEEFTPRLLGE